MDDHKTTLLNAIKGFEKQFNCTLCMYNHNGMLDRRYANFRHLNRFCTAIKERSSRRHQQCKIFDISLVHRHLLQCKKVFFKQCCAGAVEAVFPILIDDALAGTLFAGVFAGPLPAGENSLPEPGCDPPLCSDLPPLPEDLESFLAFGGLIAECIARFSVQQSPFPGTARDILLEFLRTRHKENIGLDDVAELLDLTPARASERIKREFGKSFVQLLREYRLKSACMLLENSTYPLEKVARQSGFSCGTYLSRIFKKELNTTPGEWRSAKSSHRE